jgi:hypothetical protein
VPHGLGKDDGALDGEDKRIHRHYRRETAEGGTQGNNNNGQQTAMAARGGNVGTTAARMAGAEARQQWLPHMRWTISNCSSSLEETTAVYVKDATPLKQIKAAAASTYERRQQEGCSYQERGAPWV